jgi:two-component system chemotaxis response regulator CheY
VAEPEAAPAGRDAGQALDRAAIAGRDAALTLETPMSTSAPEPRFLIVDDFPTMRRVLRALLKEIGFERAEAAANGAVALQMLRTSKFDFVISDIPMPDMDGFELVSAMRADDSLKDVPVLMVAAEDRGSRSRALSRELRIASYIVKPFTRASLEAEASGKTAPHLFPQKE